MNGKIIKNKTDSVFIRLIRLVIGGVLLFSAFTHLQQPYLLLGDTLAYRLIEGSLAIGFTAMLPFLELACAVVLFSKIKAKLAFAFAGTLLSVFLIAQSSALLRGLEIDCGCFGGLVRREIGLHSLLFLILLSSLALYGLANSRNEELEKSYQGNS